MTTSLAAAPARDRLSVWCGWVLIGAAVLVPILGWLAPLGFALLLALVGLLCLPAVRMSDQDRPVAMILFAALIWAAVSTTWSPYHPSKPGNSTILKLAFELPLYWSAISAARRADPVLRTRALHVLAWGCALFGLVLIEETVTRAAIYKAVHMFYEPIRADFAEANLGHSTFVLGLLWPLAAYGAPVKVRPWLALVMAAGTGAAAIAFGSDAPVIGLGLAPLTVLAVWRWPRAMPRLMAGGAVGLFLGMPAIIWALRHFADYAAIERALPLSYALRMGYWSHAIDWIRLEPLRGWGLDASRMFGPGIVLHPHNNPLQVWMELGAVGAVLAAALWGVMLSRLSRPDRDLLTAATAGCAAVYLLFAMFNFGIWQEWWLGLGALVALMAAANAQDRPTSGAAP
jgi:O-antigen ligase